MQSSMRNFGHVITVAALLAAAASARAEEPAPAQCFSTAQTREKIAAHRLGEPFAAMRYAAARLEGEAIGARLCRFDDEFVYEISVLKRDGHIVKIVVDAVGGKPHSAREAR